MPEPNSKDVSKYAFTGWKLTIKRDGAATAVTDVDIKCNTDGTLPDDANTLATLQKADGTALNADSLFNPSNIHEFMYTFEAQFAEGIPLVWDVETYGGSTASDFTFNHIGGGNGTTSNVVSGSTNKNELVAIVSGTSTPAYGVMQFPDVRHSKESTDMRFLGWTTNEDGTPLNGTWYTYDGGKQYKVYSDKIVEKDNESNVIYTGSTVNLKWYAVWETDIIFDAASYGGTIYGKTGNEAKSTTVTVKNNKPLTFPAAKTTGASAGDFVPNRYGNADATGWKFKGWTTQANPNNTGGVLGGSTARASSLSPAPAMSFTPNGATTYYGVWECNVAWAKAAGFSDASFEIASTPAADYLYGYDVTAPAVTKTPASHYFNRWTDPIGNNATQSGSDYVCTVKTGGTVGAAWAPNIYKVAVLDGAGQVRDDVMPGTSSKLGSLYMKYGDGWYTDVACTDANKLGFDPVANAADPTDGFTAVGYTRDYSSVTPEYWTSGTAADGFAYNTAEGTPRPNAQSFTNSHSDYTFTDASETTRQVYLYPVWRADVTWSNPYGTTASSTDGVERKYVNLGREGKVDATSAAKTVVCRDQGTRAGYEPIGWKLTYTYPGGAEDTTLYQAGDTISITGPCTIEAQWTPIEYTVELDFDTTDLITRDALNSIPDAQASSWTAAADAANGNEYKVAAGVYTVENGTAVPGEDGKLILTLPSYSRKGYEIDHWSLEGTPGVGNHTDASNSAAVASALPSSFEGGTISFPVGTAGSGVVRASFTLKAHWKEATGYDFARYEQLDGNTATPLTASSTPSYNNTLAAIPAQYTVTGLDLASASATIAAETKPGYTFAGWRAYKASDSTESVLTANAGADQATIDAVAANEPARNVSVPAGFIGDDGLVIVACFTTNYYGLTVDLGLEDAQEGTFGGNWKRPDAAQKVWQYQSLNVQENGSNIGSKDGFTVRTGNIVLPSPSRTGQQFAGWKVEKKNASGAFVELTDETQLAALLVSGTDYTFKVAPDMLGEYRLTGKWEASDYSISFDNTAYITGDYVVGGKAFDATTTNKYLFDGDHLTGAGAIEVKEPAAGGTPGFDTARYESFKGWYLPAGASEPADSVNAWAQDATEGNRWFAKSITVNQSNVDVLCGGENGLQLQARFALKSYTATLDLRGGKLTAEAAAADGWTKDSARTDLYTREYTCETADAAAPVMAFRLPVPTRYGYTFAGWDLAVDGAAEAFSRTDVNGESGWWQPKDQVGNRVYTVTEGTRWVALQDKVVFASNFPTDAANPVPGIGESTQVSVDFGAWPSAQTNLPTADNYMFAGYFDTPAASGGKQYFTAEGAAARAWDLAPVYTGEEGSQTIEPHTLYARWMPRAPEGTPDENQPVPGKIVMGPDGEPDPSLSSRAAFTAKKGEGSVELGSVGFDAFYNGFYTRDAADRVSVRIDSYVFANGVTPEGIYSAFERTDPSGQGKDHLRGFMIDSTGDVISFASIAKGQAFDFTFMASDVEGGTPASFTLLGAKVTALYTAKEFDFDDPEGGEPATILPQPGDEVMASFDANGGTITVDGKAAATAMTVTTITKTAEEFAGGARDYVSLPRVSFTDATAAYAVPVREGYEFTGWSLLPVHADAAAGEAPDHWGVDRPQGDIFAIEDILTKRYYAHWKAIGYRVALSNNDNGAASAASYVEVPFASSASLAELAGSAFTAPVHKDGASWVFLGYYDDATAGSVYFTSTGAAARPWDKVYEPGTDTITLYAHWLNAGSSAPSDPDVIPPDPGDLIPGKAPLTVTPTTAPNGNGASMVADDGRGMAKAALAGTYDGVYAVPASGGDEVAIVMSAYAPADVASGAVASAQLSLRKMIATFEGAAAPADAPYLQGFEVLSTGSTVLVSDLYAGRQVSIDCLQSDLADLVAPATLASFAFKEGAVRAIYGPNPPIKPENWDPAKPWPASDDPNTTPENEATPIHNTFDARGGAFITRDDSGAVTSQKRFASVSSGYMQKIQVPPAPSYPADETYQFEGWYTADGSKLADGASQTSAMPTTYYAKYVRTYYTFELWNDWDGVDAVHRNAAEVADGKLVTFDGESNGWPYKGQAVSTMDFVGSGLPQLTGYDFIGWYYRDAGAGEGGAAKLVPFYLNPDKFATSYRTTPEYKLRMGVGATGTPATIPNAYDDTPTETGWGTLLSDELESDQPVKLYVMWHKMTYSVKLQYNWTGADRSYVYREPGEDGEMAPKADVVIDDVAYGTAIGNPSLGIGADFEIPAVQNPLYRFSGWYAGTTEGSDKVLYQKVRYDEGGHDPDATSEYYLCGTESMKTPYYFVQRDGEYCFQPTNVTLTGDRQITLNAWFDEKAPLSYKVRVYFGQDTASVHGSIGAGAGTLGDEGGLKYIETDYVSSVDDPLTDGNNGIRNYIAADPGYSLSGYAHSADAGAQVLSSIVIPAGTTGLQKYYLVWTDKKYTVKLLLNTLQTERDGAAATEAPDGAAFAPADDGSIALDMAANGGQTIALPVPEGAKGYEFAGWKRVDNAGTFKTYEADDPRETFGAESPSLTFDGDFALYIDRTGYALDASTGEEKANSGKNGRVVYYGAVWRPLTYRLCFHEFTDESAHEHSSDCITLASEGGVKGAGDGEHAHELVLPYPHTTDNRDVFMFWSFSKNDRGGRCADWTSGKALTLREILDRVLDADGVAVEYDIASGLYAIDLYAQWKSGRIDEDHAIINVDVPLQVNILLDPWQPDREDGEGKIITNSDGAYAYDEDEAVTANAWVGADTALDADLAERGVRVESLTYERGDDGLFEMADGRDDAASFDLLVYGGGLGQSVEPLRLNLGMDATVVLLDDRTDQHDHVAAGTEQEYLVDHGLGKVIKTGDPLLIYYDLDLGGKESLADYPALTERLLDKTAPTGGRASATLAKLYYTIGLVPSALTGPTD